MYERYSARGKSKFSDSDSIEFCDITGYAHTLNSFLIHDECGDCGLTLKNYYSWWAGQGITGDEDEAIENAKDNGTATVPRLVREIALPRANERGVERFFG